MTTSIQFSNVTLSQEQFLQMFDWSPFEENQGTFSITETSIFKSNFTNRTWDIIDNGQVIGNFEMSKEEFNYFADRFIASQF